jgi:hypothetical protein
LPLPPSISPITGTTLIAPSASSTSSSSSSSTSHAAAAPIIYANNNNSSDNKGDALSITYLTLDVYDADSPSPHSNIAQYFNEVIAFIERHRHKNHSNSNSNTTTPIVHVTPTTASSSSLSLPSGSNIASSNGINSYSHGHSNSNSNSNSNGAVLVHCHSGVSRAPSLIIAWLMSVRGWTLSQSLAWLQLQRPQVQPNNGFMRQLINFERILTGQSSLSIKDYPQPIIMAAP